MYLDFEVQHFEEKLTVSVFGQYLEFPGKFAVSQIHGDQGLQKVRSFLIFQNILSPIKHSENCCSSDKKKSSIDSILMARACKFSHVTGEG